MNNIHISKKEDTSFEVLLDSRPAGSLKACIIRPGNDQFQRLKACEAVAVQNRGGSWVVEFCRDDEDVTATLELEAGSAGFSGKFTAAGSGHAVVRLVWELPQGERGFPFVPAFMYGFNEGGKSPDATYPQLDNGSNNPGFSKPWVEKEWLVRADRSSHCLSSIITDEYTCAVGGRDVCRYDDGTVAEKNGLGIGSDDPHRISFSLGFINAPYTYSVVIGRNFYGRPEGYVNLDKGSVESEFFLFLFKTRSRHQAASRLLHESYGLLRDEINDAGSVGEAVEAIADALVRYTYSEKAKNFHVTVHTDQPDDSLQEECFSSGWTGGAMAAYPLLVAGYKLKNEMWINIARDVLDNLSVNAVSGKSGLFFDNYNLNKDCWDAQGWWYPLLEQPGHSGYVNGQVCHYLLKGYRFEKEVGAEQHRWLDAARRVLDKVAEAQGEDGRFGYTYSEDDGTILDNVGFAGCWFTPAFANLYKITGDEKYLDVAGKAMDFYRKDIETFHLYGAPHDIWKSPDQEGVLAWINAARILHEVTGEKQFLDALLMGLEYEFSWKFAYNVINEVEPLKSKNWCSTGGSVTSVNNSHIHPMGSAIASSILYAYQQTKDEYLKSRLIDTVRWTLTVYLHHDGDYGWGRKGLINERFCYTDSLLNERFPDGSPAATWFCGHSWASGSVLEGLAGEILDMERNDQTTILGE